MEIIQTAIEPVVIIEPKVHVDERGWFTEDINIGKLLQHSIDFRVVQENHVLNIQRYVFRGFHYQKAPHEQAKLVRCTMGKVIDYAVDLRKDSKTYLQHVAVELSAENKRQLFVPKGFAHGVMNLSETAEIQYFVDEPYSPECDRSIRWNDPEIGIDWRGIVPVLSQKDRSAPTLVDCGDNT